MDWAWFAFITCGHLLTQTCIYDPALRNYPRTLEGCRDLIRNERIFDPYGPRTIDAGKACRPITIVYTITGKPFEYQK